MSHLVEMTGQQVERLTVLDQSDSVDGKASWRCRCVCGTVIVATRTNLRAGNTRSCGCLQRELLAARQRKHGMSRLRHQRPRTSTYVTWMAMRTRCSNPRRVDWPLYGGRGVRVCAAWQESFETFLRDMGERPDGCSLDRIDPNGDYELGNCRWATPAEQRRNQRIRPAHV